MIRSMKMHYQFTRLQDLAQRTGRPITSLALKTTGVTGTSSGIVQVGLITIRPGVPTRGIVGYVNPQMPITSEATDQHGITDDKVAKTDPFSAWGEVVAKIALHTVTGFNLAIYEVPIIHAQCVRYGMDAPAFDHACDLKEVLDVHHKTHGHSKTKEQSLAHYADHYNVARDGERDALDDALTTLLIAEAVIGQHGDTLLNIIPATVADRGIESIGHDDEPELVR